MTDIILSPSQFPSNPSTISPINNDGFHQQTFLNHDSLISGSAVDLYSRSFVNRQVEEEVGEREGGNQLSVLAVVLTVVRNSLVGCNNTSGEDCGGEEKLMDIGWPTNVRHIAHVTFDRFNGFLGLPVEFEPEVPRRPPSASTRVFGVSTESMQLSFDPRGNCVPTILLMMQRRLYLQGGLESEGIFRINPENGQEEYVRERLNNGVIPENIDVHCLAGLIKAWFRELPSGILDSLSPEHVIEAQSEEECSQVVSLLPPTEAALLDWAVNLMADVAQFEIFNKMNARNIAMVFAPNMTQMLDPLTALMYAVRVMNFLKTLVEKTLRERVDCLVELGPTMHLEPTDEDDHHTKRANDLEGGDEASDQDHEPEVAEEQESCHISSSKPDSCHFSSSTDQAESRTGNNGHGFLASMENILSDGKREKDDNSPLDHPNTMKDILEGGDTNVGIKRTQSRNRRTKNDAKKGSKERTDVRVDETVEKKKKDINVLSRVNSHAEMEAWR